MMLRSDLFPSVQKGDRNAVSDNGFRGAVTHKSWLLCSLSRVFLHADWQFGPQPRSSRQLGYHNLPRTKTSPALPDSARMVMAKKKKNSRLAILMPSWLSLFFSFFDVAVSQPSSCDSPGGCVAGVGSTIVQQSNMLAPKPHLLQ